MGIWRSSAFPERGPRYGSNSPPRTCRQSDVFTLPLLDGPPGHIFRERHILESVIAAPPRARRYRGGVYTWSPGSWQRIKRDVVRIEVEQFGKNAFDAAYLEREFSAPESIVVLMSDRQRNAIVGFTYAVPAEYIDWPRRSGDFDTAYICDTVLDAQHQGMGLVTELMAVLEGALRARGYRFVERDAAVANGYAAKIDRAYQGRIEVRGEERDSQYGMQRFFRIRL